MRRVIPSLVLGALLGSALPAQEPPSLLGAGGEVYRVERGLYRDLFPSAPATQAQNPVLALEVSQDGRVERTLVPGSEGPGPEQAVGLAADGTRVYLLWGDGREMQAIGWSAAGWDRPYVLDVDPASSKVNPMLVATTDQVPAIGGDGAAATERTVLHLAWVDRGERGERLLYTALVSQAGELQRANRVVDLQQLALRGDKQVSAPLAATSLQQRPQLRVGRDGKSALVGFADEGGELVTLELRPVGADITGFADKARAVVIETGRANPGASRSALAEKARAVVIETGRGLFRPAVADALAKAFLDGVAASEGVELEPAAEGAAQLAIAAGAELLTLPAKSDFDTELVELAGPQDGAAGRQVLDLRRASRRALPELPPADVRVFLSRDGDHVSLAWVAANVVRYRESEGTGWGPQRTLQLGPSFTRDDAFALVQKRLASR